MDWAELAEWVSRVKESDLPAPPIALTSAIRIHDVSRYLAALRGEVAKGADTARARTGALEREVSRLMKLASTLPSAPIGKAPAEAIQVREPCKPDADSPPGPSGSVIVAFDFETTGLYPDESDIIEIGGVKFTPTGEVAGRFERFANPGCAIPPESSAVSGITTEMVAGAEPPLTVLEAFIEWAGPNAVYVAHNAAFDAGFLEATYTKARRKCPPLKVADTLEWARSLGLRTPNYKLGTLLDYYGKSTEGLHRSMADAHGVMELVLQFIEGHLTPLDEVLRWAKPLPLPAAWRR
ncbi:MAG TPA: 3'-5' exonuclease [Candidatus Hydrogenedentes bacterium]|nr:3'-5' exonuclease [Candidatus Hydrogenedentota bacterium]